MRTPKDPGARVPRERLRAALDLVALDGLRYATVGLAALYAVLALTSGALPEHMIRPVAAWEVVIVVAMLVTHAAVRKGLVPRAAAHPVALVLVALVLGDVVLHMTLRFEPSDTMNMMLLVLGVGFLFTSPAWLAVALTVIAVTWAGIVWVNPPSPLWREFGFALFEAMVLAVIVFVVRVRTLTRMERMRQQDEVKQHDLESANADLEAFTAMASHDLRAPVRGVAYVLDALKEDHGGKLGKEGRDLLDRGRREATRMHALIEDLLAHARAARAEMDVERVDVTAIARNVAAALAERDPDRAVTVHVEDGLEAYADAGLLRVTLENLLGNAWKFTRDRDAAHVTVRGATWDDEPAFSVEDDGIGFPPERASDLFRPFERAHAASAFEGTGLGLATVKRIIDRHGGRIRAEGREGEGARFTFTLPGNLDD